MTEPNRSHPTRPPRVDLRHEPQGPSHRLVLTELPHTRVFDTGGIPPASVSASGSVRETCPHCREHLKRVLRQHAVRLAHLFCDQCGACYDAHYPDGRCALTI